MRRIFLAFVFAILGAVSLAHAAEPLWEKDGALLAQVIARAQSGGIGAIGAQAGAMKKALAGAKKLFPGPVEVDGASYILVDGKAESKAALAKAGKGTTAIENPYQLMGLMLGSYYVETRKFKEAVSALDTALTLSPLPKGRLGTVVPNIYSERGVALGQLKRWKEALANYDAGLSIASMDKSQRALLHRGRGFALIELGRLDEAEAAYNASLKLEPGSAIAKNELAYIAGIKGGAKPVKPSVVSPGASN